MPETVFKAFLSCSFAQEDRVVTEFFERMIRSFNIETIVYDYQEIGRIPDKAKENIIRSDCLIAVATKRKKIEGSDHWTYPDWIQHEIALANAYNKPIAMFVEEGVKIEGFIAMEERRERFERERLIDNIDKITAFLFNLRRHLELNQQAGILGTPVLLRHYIRTKEEMVSKELTIERTEISMESLIDGLESSHHYIDLEETTPGLSIKPREFDFKCKEMPSDTKVEYEVVLNTNYRFFWKMLFDPPLTKGAKVKYAYKEVRPNHRPYTYDEILERIRAGTYEYKEPICEACEWTIVYPTLELHSEFEFPENYEIVKCHPYVAMGATRMKADSEIKRIQNGNMFTAEKIFDKWVLKLKVPKPLPNHTYYTLYEPPKASNL